MTHRSITLAIMSFALLLDAEDAHSSWGWMSPTPYERQAPIDATDVKIIHADDAPSNESALHGSSSWLERADDERSDPASSRRLNLSLRGGAMRLGSSAWDWGPCIAAAADIALTPSLFASGNAWYGWAPHGSPEYTRMAFGEGTPNPAYKAFALTIGLGYRTAAISHPALYLSAGGGVATYRTPYVPEPGRSYGVFGFEPNTVPTEDVTSLIVGVRGGFEYPFSERSRAVLEGGYVRDLGSTASQYFIPITAGVSINL